MNIPAWLEFTIYVMIGIVLSATLFWVGHDPHEEKVEQIDKPKRRCPWCQDEYGNTDLDFTVLDDMCGQYVRYSQIKFCPFCGRDLSKDDTD